MMTLALRVIMYILSYNEHTFKDCYELFRF